jgi:hypothetical protein
MDSPAAIEAIGMVDRVDRSDQSKYREGFADGGAQSVLI